MSDLIERLRCKAGSAGAVHIATRLEAANEISRLSSEGERKDEALTTLAALYGFHAKHLRKMGSCFRDNLELSLDETLPAERIEELLQTAWKASERGVGAAVSEELPANVDKCK